MNTNHIDNRAKILAELRQELVGPSIDDPDRYVDLDCDGPEPYCMEKNTLYRQKGNREEILQMHGFVPLRRYGVGVLYPSSGKNGCSQNIDIDLSENMEENEPENEPNSFVDLKNIEDNLENTNYNDSDAEVDEFSVQDWTSVKSLYRPSCLGISFLVRQPLDSKFTVEIMGGSYRKGSVINDGKKELWWFRQPVRLKAEFVFDRNITKTETINLSVVESSVSDKLKLNIGAVVRPRQNDSEYLVTVYLKNASSNEKEYENESALFQTEMKIVTTGEIRPYPERFLGDNDEKDFYMLLYRNRPCFALGHGCAATWNNIQGVPLNEIYTTSFPVFEMDSLTPNITTDDGKQLSISMSKLSTKSDPEECKQELRKLVNEYEKWIEKRKKEADQLPKCYCNVAKRQIDACHEALERMEKGVDFLDNDTKAFYAFRLANDAMILQQERPFRVRNWNSQSETFDPLDGQYEYNPSFGQNSSESDRKWRAFQIAFILMSLESVANDKSTDRDTVDLIWFATGGGKTEAYLGLAAFSIFLRRLRNPEDTGTQVLMRYTLRLLTAQQFLRASRLICSMEYMRQMLPELGNRRFSVGIWIGTTPKNNKSAKEEYEKLCKEGVSEKSFVVDRCPWCAAQIGCVERKEAKRGRKNKYRVLGYESCKGTVYIYCEDPKCPFCNDNKISRLPVVIIDEEIYSDPPTFIIATVDKFASLVRKEDARSLFGIDKNGKRVNSPPSLIIQDELHLISGPLGTMVGLYESLIEYLCVYNLQEMVKPKIVCSTATIKNFTDQVRSLYARKKTVLFPPPGLSIDDSFFAQKDNSSNTHGRMYVGVYAPGLGSLQTTQVRTFTSLYQASRNMEPVDKDPWSTIMMFFNSFRELGTTVTILQTVYNDYVNTYACRYKLDWKNIRRLRYHKELTSRVQSSDIQKVFAELELDHQHAQETGKTPLDVCLATNIIEVGIDIDRLSLLMVTGQPKNASQYIQVSGRVGRRTDCPVLIVTVYSVGKARDRSHFENFRPFHERLYTNVEPCSVTPFSAASLERALHSIMIGAVRQTGVSPVSSNFSPETIKALSQFKEWLENRIKYVDSVELATLETLWKKRRKEWSDRAPVRWETNKNNESLSDCLFCCDEEKVLNNNLWYVHHSLRNVDTECKFRDCPYIDSMTSDGESYHE